MTKLALRLAVSASALAASLAAASLACATTARRWPRARRSERRAGDGHRGTADDHLQSAPLAASVISGAQLQANGIEGWTTCSSHPVADGDRLRPGQPVQHPRHRQGSDQIQTPSGWSPTGRVASFPGFFQDAPTTTSPMSRSCAAAGRLRRPERHRRGGVHHHQRPAPRLIRRRRRGTIRRLQRRSGPRLHEPADQRHPGLRVAVNGEQRDSFYHVTGPWTTPNGATPGSLKEGSFRVGLLCSRPTPSGGGKADYNYVDHDGYPPTPRPIRSPACSTSPTTPTTTPSTVLPAVAERQLHLRRRRPAPLDHGLSVRHHHPGVDLDGSDSARRPSPTTAASGSSPRS